MANEPKPNLLRDSFPSNRIEGSTKIQTEKKPAEKKIKKVVTNAVTQKKRSFGKRLAEDFLEDDAKSVGQHIFWDVLIPAAKSAICDVVGWGGMAEMILFGSVKGGRNTTRQGGRTYINYNQVGRQPGNFGQGGAGREITPQARNRHDFGDVIFQSRGEAEEVLSTMMELIEGYGMVSVADFYEMVGLEKTYTDEKWGWIDLSSSSVYRGKGGYSIVLPRTISLD